MSPRRRWPRWLSCWRTTEGLQDLDLQLGKRMSHGRIDFYSLTRSVHAPYPGAAGPRWPERPISSSSELAGEAMVFLTEVHEHDHFAVLLASPLGRLLWRTESVQVVDGL